MRSAYRRGPETATTKRQLDDVLRFFFDWSDANPKLHVELCRVSEDFEGLTGELYDVAIAEGFYHHSMDNV
ncbi:hypothetical protein LCGC14_0686320 [marine sediment metagenome]|uniref:Uncharacterized protein n=1 Tax=marine sediment metagenome TaxID=412755 RepID=A0A0F9QLU1_9ZZZZ